MGKLASCDTWWNEFVDYGPAVGFVAPPVPLPELRDFPMLSSFHPWPVEFPRLPDPPRKGWDEYDSRGILTGTRRPRWFGTAFQTIEFSRNLSDYPFKSEPERFDWSVFESINSVLQRFRPRVVLTSRPDERSGWLTNGAGVRKGLVNLVALDSVADAWRHHSVGRLMVFGCALDSDYGMLDLNNDRYRPGRLAGVATQVGWSNYWRWAPLSVADIRRSGPGLSGWSSAMPLFGRLQTCLSVGSYGTWTVGAWARAFSSCRARGFDSATSSWSTSSRVCASP